MQTLHQVPDKVFHLAYTAWMRGKFQYFCA
jgi:hypothetical protein